MERSEALTGSPSFSNSLRRLFQGSPQHAFFEALADTLSDSVFVLSRGGSHILTCNHTFVLQTGYSKADLERLSLLELFPGEIGQTGLGRLFDRRRGPSFELRDVPLRTQQGTITLVDLAAHPAGAGGDWLLVMARPSSLRLVEEARRAATQDRLKYLTEMIEMVLGGSFAGLEGILGTGRKLLSASYAGVYRLSPSDPEFVAEGVFPESFPGKLPASAMQAIHRPQDWSFGQRTEHDLHRAARVSGTSILMTRPLGQTNAWVGVLLAGWRDPAEVPDDVDSLLDVLAGTCNAALQIGMQQASLAQLGRIAEHLEDEMVGQFRGASEALLLLDSDFRIVRANPAALETLGYVESEVIGHPVRDVLVGPSDILTTLLDAQGHQRMAESASITLHRRDGTPFPTHLRAMPASDADPARLLVTLADQSERQAIEDHHAMLTQRALLGDVMAIFAHEVRNPIHSISTGVQLAASRLGEEHPLYAALEKIRRECNRLDQLMNDVLFFSRPLQLKMEPTDLREMVERLLARWEPRLRQSSVRVHAAFEPDVPLVAADPRTFEQVIVNLINNALQAMDSGGTLSVAVEPAASPQGPAVEVKIGDTGPGISPKDLERIFDPFYSTKRDGTGLGLAISRRIVAAHQGSLTPQSFPDAGTVFTIRIPAIERPALPGADSDAGSELPAPEILISPDTTPTVSQDLGGHKG